MISLTVVEDFNGVVLYRGPSRINGKPIVVIATGLCQGSKNIKTGDFIQTYILSDEGESPIVALSSGKDSSVCGDCIHRKVDGWGTCYVNLGQGPNNVYKAYIAGRYPDFQEYMLDEYFAKRVVRLGAYGDPVAIPIGVWDKILGVSDGHTGYTHQWRRFPEYKRLVMASVETRAQQERARKLGWKTFRVRNEDEGIGEHEFICPASKEAGKRLRCEDCMACCGGEWNGKTVTPVIMAHGTHYKPLRFKKMQKLMRNKKRYRYLGA